MSGAILYAAIVAIWALILVPRWLRRPHASETLESNLAEPVDTGRSEDLALAEEDQDARDGEADEDDGDGQADEDGEGEEAEEESEADLTGTRDEGAAAGPPPAQRRGRVLRARRRTLMTLIVLTAAAVAAAVTHRAALWVIAPPAVMLGGFALLLREAARIDTRRARAATVRDGSGADAAAAAWVPQARPADGLPVSEPNAKVIDISARVGDQLYDQYADVKVRAIGD